MILEITYDQEEDGRWIARIESLCGVSQYGNTKEEATRNVKIVALQALKWMLEDGELENLDTISFKVTEAIAV